MMIFNKKESIRWTFIILAITFLVINIIYCLKPKSPAPILEIGNSDQILIKGKLCSFFNDCQDALLFNAAINKENLDILIDYINVNFHKKDINICFNSGGGDIEAAIEFYSSVKAVSYIKTCVTDIYDPYEAIYKQTQCNSACPILWLSGAGNIISGQSKIGFHNFYTEEFCWFCIVNLPNKYLKYIVNNKFENIVLNSIGNYKLMFESGMGCGINEMSFYDSDRLINDFKIEPHKLHFVLPHKIHFVLNDKDDIKKILPINSDECRNQI